MAPPVFQQGRRPVEAEDFASQIAAISSDEEDEGNDDREGNNGTAYTPPSLLVVPDPPNIEVPPPGSTAAAFRQAMMEFQREVLRLRDLAQQLVEEVARLHALLQNQAVAKTNSSKSLSASSSAVSSNPPGWTAEWNEFARQYMYLVSPWRADYAFGLAAHPGIDPTSPACYTDEISMRAAQAAELYELVPPKFHPVLARANSGFADKFKKKVQSARSNLLSMLITHAGEIFDMPAHYFPRNSAYDRSKDPAMQRLLRDTLGTYGRYARVMFAGEDGEVNMARPFQSVYLVRIILLMLNGPTALASSTGPSMGQPPVGKRWKIRNVCGGLLASALTYLLYILSPDTSLQHNKVGDKTGINYTLRFDEYKQIYYLLSPERKGEIDDFFLVHVFHVAPQAPPSAAPLAPMSLEEGLLAINCPSLVGDSDLSSYGRLVGDKQPPAVSMPLADAELLVVADELSYAEPNGRIHQVAPLNMSVQGQSPAIVHPQSLSSASNRPPSAIPTVVVPPLPVPLPSTQPTVAHPVAPPSAYPVAPPSARPVAPPSARPVVPPSARPIAPPSARPVAPPSARPVAPPSAPTTPLDAAPIASPTTSHTSAGIRQLEADVGGLTLAEPLQDVVGTNNQVTNQGRSAPATRSRSRNTALRGVEALAPIPGDTPEAPVIAALHGGRRKRKP